MDDVVAELQAQGLIVFDDGPWLDPEDSSQDGDARSRIPLDDVRHVERIVTGSGTRIGGWASHTNRGVEDEPTVDELSAKARQERISFATTQQLWHLLKLVPDALQDLITGVFREDLDRDGNVIRVYKERPDLGAIRVVLDRTLGKPITNLNLSGVVEHEFSLDSYTLEERRMMLLIAAEGIDQIIDTAAQEPS